MSVLTLKSKSQQNGHRKTNQTKPKRQIQVVPPLPYILSYQERNQNDCASTSQLLSPFSQSEFAVILCDMLNCNFKKSIIHLVTWTIIANLQNNFVVLVPNLTDLYLLIQKLQPQELLVTIYKDKLTWVQTLLEPMHHHHPYPSPQVNTKISCKHLEMQHLTNFKN